MIRAGRHLKASGNRQLELTKEEFEEHLAFQKSYKFNSLLRVDRLRHNDRAQSDDATEACAAAASYNRKAALASAGHFED